MRFIDKPISASALKSLSVSVEHLWANHHDPLKDHKASDAMLLGTMVHALLLEPDTFEGRFVTMPEGMIKRGKAYEAFKAGVPEGAEIVSDKLAKKADFLASRVHLGGFGPLMSGGVPELKIEWTDTENYSRPVDFVGFVDYAGSCGHVIDVKTTSSFQSLGKAAADGRWDLQHVQYRNGLGERFVNMSFLVIETVSPFRIRLAKLCRDTIALGSADHHRLVEKYIDLVDNGAKPSESCRSQEISFPSYVTNQLEKKNGF